MTTPVFIVLAGGLAAPPRVPPPVGAGERFIAAIRASGPRIWRVLRPMSDLNRFDD